jgi:diguanylate cyclase (GGDEF)-like protein
MDEHQEQAMTPNGSQPMSTESLSDPVSGLPDGRFFQLSVDRKVALARRTLKPLAICVVEIDDFKGFAPYLRDHAVRVLTRVMQNTLRDSDTVCQLREGVLAAVLDDTSETGAVWAADRIRRALLETPAREVVTVSAGLACYPSHAMAADDLLNEAEHALSTARGLGPGRIEVAAIDPM